MTTTAVAATPATDTRPRRSTHQEMRVGGGSNPQALASAISHAVYDNRPVLLRVIGAGAVNQAIKGFIIARGFVAPRGFDIALVPGWADVQGEKGDDLSAMTLRVVILY